MTAPVNDKSGLTRLALSDPYISISYSGVEGVTSLLYADYNPVFFQDIVYNIEVGVRTEEEEGPGDSRTLSYPQV